MNSDERLFPYYFVVEIEGIQGARFKKCSGLEIHTNIIEIEEGGYNCSTRKFIGGTSYNNIILEHGITNNNDLYNWCFYSSLADNERERKNGSIVLMNLAGEEIKRWNFFRAFPCRWVGPTLVAGLHGEYAIEKVEIALEELRVDSDENEENLQVAVNENEEELQADSVESEVEVVPTYFTQGQWADDFDQEFANNACTATSLLNEISEEYTRHTGTAMTFEQGVAAMQSAIDNNGIRRYDAFISNWQNAETGMWNSTGLPGTLQNNEQSTEHIIYASDTNNNPATAEHFVNSANEGEYFDPLNGNIGNVEDLNLQEGRPRRGFDYIPPEETR